MEIEAIAKSLSEKLIKNKQKLVKNHFLKWKVMNLVVFI